MVLAANAIHARAIGEIGLAAIPARHTAASPPATMPYNAPRKTVNFDSGRWRSANATNALNRSPVVNPAIAVAIVKTRKTNPHQGPWNGHLIGTILSHDSA
jgi:hypothetical protein